jgi:hypothetical protein
VFANGITNAQIYSFVEQPVHSYVGRGVKPSPLPPSPHLSQSERPKLLSAWQLFEELGSVGNERSSLFSARLWFESSGIHLFFFLLCSFTLATTPPPPHYPPSLPPFSPLPSEYSALSDLHPSLSLTILMFLCVAMRIEEMSNARQISVKTDVTVYLI